MNEINPNTAIAEIFMHAEKAQRDEKAIAKAKDQGVSIAALEAKGGQKMSEAEAKRVSKEFEALFLGQMMEAMVPKAKDDGSLFGKDKGDEIFQSMMMDEYAKQISKAGGIGIASSIERELLGINTAPAKPVNYDLQVGAYERTDEQNKEPLEADNKGDKI